MGIFSPEPPRQKIGGQSQGSILLAEGQNTGTCFAGTLRAVLEGHCSPPQGPQRTITWLFATWHLDGSLRAAVQFLVLSYLLCVMQAWCQAVEQLPFSISWPCQSEQAHPHLFAVAAHGILMTSGYFAYFCHLITCTTWSHILSCSLPWHASLLLLITASLTATFRDVSGSHIACIYVCDHQQHSLLPPENGTKGQKSSQINPYFDLLCTGHFSFTATLEIIVHPPAPC